MGVYCLISELMGLVQALRLRRAASGGGRLASAGVWSRWSGVPLKRKRTSSMGWQWRAQKALNTLDSGVVLLHCGGAERLAQSENSAAEARRTGRGGGAGEEGARERVRGARDGERRGANAAGIFDYKLNDNIMTWPAVATWLL